MEKIRELFGVDLRSLALYRICLALLILADLIRRSTDLTAHYTDAGVLPRAILYKLKANTFLLAPHFWSGSVYYEAFLFLISALFAVALLVGYRTRLATFACWFLMLSLHERNHMILYGGDGLLRVMLFWSLFIPMGAYFSVDRSLSKSPPPPFPYLLSPGTFAFILQICIMYWSAATHKWNEDWLGGKAIEITLNIEQFTSDAGLWLKQQTAWLPSLTYLTLFAESIGPSFAFIPFYTGPIRTATVAAFILLHIGFGLFLKLGLFSFICTIAWFFFLPSWFWDRLLPHLSFLRPLPFEAQFRRVISHLKPRNIDWNSYPLEKVIVIFLIIYNAFATAYLHHPEWVEYPLVKKYGSGLASMLRVNQKWNMFSKPLRDDGWYVVEGILVGGGRVDLFQEGAPLTWKKPASVSSMYTNDRWRKYMMNLWTKSNYQHRGYFSDYLCHTWQESHANLMQLRSIRIYFMLEKTLSDLSKGTPEKVLIWEQSCPPPDKTTGTTKTTTENHEMNNGQE